MRRQRKQTLSLVPPAGLPKGRSAGRSKNEQVVGGGRPAGGERAVAAAAAARTERRRLVQPLWSALDEHLGERAARGLLLAVSGGPDSRALLEACACWSGRFEGELHVVSVDHGTRPSSRDEAVAVVARARVLGFDATVARIPAALRGGPFDEATLRDARYQVLVDRAGVLGLCSIVVAHHESDLAEGALLSWLGGGGNGAAMARVRAAGPGAGGRTGEAVEIVRPFLGLARATLRLALTGLGVSDVVVDPERSSRRAGLRDQELAALGGRRQAVERHLARAAQRRRDDEEVLGAGARALLEPLDDGTLVRAGPPALLRRALRLALARAVPGADARASSPAIDGIVELMERGKSAQVHLKGAVAQVAAAGVVVRAVPAIHETARTVAAEPGSTHDGLERLSQGRSLVTLLAEASAAKAAPRRWERKQRESIEADEEDP